MYKYICQKCGHGFDEYESGTTYEMIGEGVMRGLCPMEMCCPECGSTELDDARECEFCGEIYSEDDMIDVDGVWYCKECAKAVVDAFNDKWAKIKAS